MSDSTRDDRTVRVFIHWLRRWLKTAKPTEWITCLTILSGAVVAYRSGILDTKKGEIAAGNALLKLEQKKLEADKAKIENEIRKAEEALEGTRGKLARAEGRLGAMTQRVNATLEAASIARAWLSNIDAIT